MKVLLLLLLLLSTHSVLGEGRSIRVFVALCDNASQGIARVPPKIGDGNVPDDNLYWGCTDGLKAYFKASSKWQLVKREAAVSNTILERLTFKHRQSDLELVAEAYRGSEIKQCLIDFHQCIVNGNASLVAYIGHDGLMEFDFPLPEGKATNHPDVIVLCCSSRTFFETRIEAIGGRPALLTDQLMYPGAFILHDAIEVWRQKRSLAEIRTAAAVAYAKNQHISVTAAKSVFSALPDSR